MHEEATEVSEAQLNEEKTMHKEATEESEAQVNKAAVCTVSVYDLKHMIEKYQLLKMPGASYQIASVGGKKKRKPILLPSLVK